MWHANGDAHIHSDGNSDANGAVANGDSDGNCHIHADSDCDGDCHIHANSDSDIYCNGYGNGDCNSDRDRTAAAYTDATATADTAAACGQLL